MESNKSYTQIRKLQEPKQINTEHIIESDITFPDYYPDIVKVVKSSIRTNILSVTAAESKVTVEANALVSILYTSTDEKLHSFEQRIPFSKTAEFKNAGSSVCSASANTQFVNCLVLSQRRISIHSSLNIKIESGGITEKQIFTSSDDSSICMHKRKVESMMPKSCDIKFFKINETLEIGSSQPTISQIIGYTAYVLPDSVKVISGKVLAKGSVQIKIIYLNEGEASAQKFESSVAFSQIIEADVDEGDAPFVSLTLAGTELFAKTDTTGTLRLIDLSANIKAEIYSFKKSELEVVDDAYSTKASLDVKSERIRYSDLNCEFRESFSQKDEIDFGTLEINEVIDVQANAVNCECRTLDGEIEYSGSALFGFLLNTEGEGIVYQEKPLDFSLKRKLETNGAVQSIYNMVVTGVAYTISDSNRIDLHSEYELNALIMNSSEIQAVTDIECSEEEKKDGEAYITVYFADKGEKLWDIAKKFKTSVDTLKTENGIESDDISDSTRLIIVK